MDRFREWAYRRRALVPYEFPWTVPGVMYTSTLLIVGCAVIQRGFTHPWLLASASLLALAPILTFLLAGYKLNTLWSVACSLAGVALFLSWPENVMDAAPFLLMFTLGEIGALASVRAGLLAASACVALLVVAEQLHHLGTLSLFMVFFLLCGWMIGRIMQLQQRLLLQERAQQVRMQEQAASDERRRIAREIHDVIAHSLSVTMLHLTGARRALQEDRDVEDAVAGLVDAERLGRQAMSDIRGTVGLLSRGPDGVEPMRLAPEPGIADLPDLVADFTAAGMAVESDIGESDGSISAGVGLALYRVAQESLANIAKHSPESSAAVHLDVSGTAVSLTVRNDLTPGVRMDMRAGGGLSGMRQRVEVLGGEFRAGPEREGWTVSATVPLESTGSQCRQRRKVLWRHD
ncbi:two-component sensor histidine kinase [Mycobacterium sp. CBMA271]|uniref:sensor histidine kinase n=1 Tax=unclassified Mycobacteroides TaxID=2618759 RepID=UPI0012DF48B9|nr:MULTISPECIES: histidine kinase [unclassified Mycobacteroides]MUM16239.1 two-component sensor histidine kinase [Mycobacteroides sp. CBMA 326]MUM22258.1 two-component sensor histidine kinase [Mycobacteroides sp. CBMA 271]